MIHYKYIFGKRFQGHPVKFMLFSHQVIRMMKVFCECGSMCYFIVVDRYCQEIYLFIENSSAQKKQVFRDIRACLITLAVRYR